MDFGGDYQKQKTVEGSYKNLKLKGTLDRFLVFDKPDSEGFESVIRDTKTTGDILRFPFQAYNDLGYDVSMVFYYLLIFLTEKKKSKLVLDVVQTTGNFPSRVYEIPQEMIQNVLDNKIMPKLELLSVLHKQYEESKDPSIWKVRVPFDTLVNSDTYYLMETTIQQEIELLQ